MVREAERKTEHETETENWGKEKTRQGVTNSFIKRERCRDVRNYARKKILIMDYDIQEKSDKISVICRFQRMAKNRSSGICQIWGKFGAYHQFSGHSENLNISAVGWHLDFWQNILSLL